MLKKNSKWNQNTWSTKQMGVKLKPQIIFNKLENSTMAFFMSLATQMCKENLKWSPESHGCIFL
jgi:hypothetical protein